VKADPKGVLTGAHYLDGDFACGEGAMAAGVRFVAGYPITPSTEVVERIGRRFPFMGGTFIQMEDEMAAMAAIVGGAWTGSKCITVTSGPGYSLMMENIGLAAMMETPCVIVNVQRGGPSTGLPTMVGQADVMQARWGSHGDYEIIAICPQSPQEAFDYTIDAVNLSEIYRVPVMVMLDECVGHMTEKVIIPPADEIEVVPRKLTEKKPGEYWPYELSKGAYVPENVRAGDGYRFHTTGLTHDDRGYPDMSEACQKVCVNRLVDKINENADDIVRFEEEWMDDADVVVVSFGITARIARMAVTKARDEGIKCGFVRLIILWPFPEKRIRELAGEVNGFVMAENNLGQMVLELERCVGGQAKTLLAGHAGGGVHDPDDIVEQIREAAK